MVVNVVGEAVRTILLPDLKRYLPVSLLPKGDAAQKFFHNIAVARGDVFFRQYPICPQHELYGLNQIRFSLFQSFTLSVGAGEFLNVPNVTLW